MYGCGTDASRGWFAAIVPSFLNAQARSAGLSELALGSGRSVNMRDRSGQVRYANRAVNCARTSSAGGSMVPVWTMPPANVFQGLQPKLAVTRVPVRLQLECACVGACLRGAGAQILEIRCGRTLVGARCTLVFACSDIIYMTNAADTLHVETFSDALRPCSHPCSMIAAAYFIVVTRRSYSILTALNRLPISCAYLAPASDQDLRIVQLRPSGTWARGHLDF